MRGNPVIALFRYFASLLLRREALMLVILFATVLATLHRGDNEHRALRTSQLEGGKKKREDYGTNES